jgi:hypothetical protein
LPPPLNPPKKSEPKYYTKSSRSFVVIPEKLKCKHLMIKQSALRVGEKRGERKIWRG